MQGRKQGVTKRNVDTKAARLSICKKELMHCFVKVCDLINLNICDKSSCSTYTQLKSSAGDYQQTWLKIKAECFSAWTVKNKVLEQFCIQIQS